MVLILAATFIIVSVFYIISTMLGARKMKTEMEEIHKGLEESFKEMEEDHKKGYKPLEGRAKDVFTGTYCAK